ncbi:TPA: hypothetical protein ACHKRV_001761, partial [Enterococcus faecium]
LLFKNFLHTQDNTLISQPLGKRCAKACICGNKSIQVKNIRSCFCLAVLITCCRAAFSQPILSG